MKMYYRNSVTIGLCKHNIKILTIFSLLVKFIGHNFHSTANVFFLTGLNLYYWHRTHQNFLGSSES